MKATLTFILPEDQVEFENASKGVEWLLFVIELDQKVRAKLKYQEVTAEQRAVLEQVRDWIIAGLDERGLRLYQNPPIFFPN